MLLDASKLPVTYLAVTVMSTIVNLSLSLIFDAQSVRFKFWFIVFVFGNILNELQFCVSPNLFQSVRGC